MSLQHQPAETDLDPGGMRIRQRLRALRGRYPGVALATELTHIHDDQVVIRAIISFPDGTAVSAYAAEPTDSTGLLDGALELAEQRATARALDLLGVGDVPESRRESRREELQAGVVLPDLPSEEVADPEPVRTPIVRPEERNTPSVVEALRRGSQTRAASPQPAPEVAEDVADQSPPAARQGRPVITAPVTPRPDPDPERPSSPPETTVEAPRRPDRSETSVAARSGTDAAEPDMADYSWTHFWTWAREYDLKTKGQVEQRIGRTIDGLAPQEVRQLLNDVGIPL